MRTMTRRALVAAALGATALAGCSKGAGEPVAGDVPSVTDEPAASPTADETLSRTAREAEEFYGRGILATLGPAEELFSTASPTPGTVEELSYSCHVYAVEEAEGRDDLVVEKRLLVYLPHGYDPAVPHEVLYLLHGTAGDERYWLSDEAGNFGPSTRNLLDALHDQGAIESTIVVAPTYYSVPEGFEVDRSLGGDDPYADLWPLHFWRELREDIVPLVEATYATHAGGDVSSGSLEASRDHRAFAGLSRGSMTSVNSVLMHCLDWFSRVGSFSGAWADLDEFRSALEDDFAGFDVGFWYNGDGSRDFALQNHEEFVHASLEALPDLLVDGENFAWVCLPGGEHSYPSWGTHLHNSLRMFFSA